MFHRCDPRSLHGDICLHSIWIKQVGIYVSEFWAGFNFMINFHCSCYSVALFLSPTLLAFEEVQLHRVVLVGAESGGPNLVESDSGLNSASVGSDFGLRHDPRVGQRSSGRTHVCVCRSGRVDHAPAVGCGEQSDSGVELT